MRGSMLSMLKCTVKCTVSMLKCTVAEIINWKLYNLDNSNAFLPPSLGEILYSRTQTIISVLLYLCTQAILSTEYKEVITAVPDDRRCED